MHDYKASLQSKERALAIHIKLFGEEHESTANSYKGLGTTQHEMHLLQSSSSYLEKNMKALLLTTTGH